jgi:hypothetical protein
MNRVVVALVTLVAVGVSVAADTNPLLTQLGEDLKVARSLPMGAKTSFRCPEHLDQLKGIAMASVLAALSKPDYENGDAHSYFLTSPTPPSQKGGGFPEITFFSSKSGTVERITCFYSR